MWEELNVKCFLLGLDGIIQNETSHTEIGYSPHI